MEVQNKPKTDKKNYYNLIFNYIIQLLRRIN